MTKKNEIKNFVEDKAEEATVKEENDNSDPLQDYKDEIYAIKKKYEDSINHYQQAGIDLEIQFEIFSFFASQTN